MTSSTSTIPDTFEEYVALHSLPVDPASREGWRKVYEQEKVVEANAPSIIPPCPEWCADPEGHPYDGWMEQGGLIYNRFHEVRVGNVTVSALERNRSGFATISPAEVFVDGEKGLPLDKVRVLAADLQATVELLERIERG